MTLQNERYQHAKLVLVDQGWDISHLEQLALSIPRVSSDDQDSVFADFHNTADRFPYAFDSDIGALMLEHIADQCDNPNLCVRLYKEATYRSSWCAQSATSGGEGRARSADLRRLTIKMQNKMQ